MVNDLNFAKKKLQFQRLFFCDNITFFAENNIFPVGHHSSLRGLNNFQQNRPNAAKCGRSQGQNLVKYRIFVYHL